VPPQAQWRGVKTSSAGENIPSHCPKSSILVNDTADLYPIDVRPGTAAAPNDSLIRAQTAAVASILTDCNLVEIEPQRLRLLIGGRDAAARSNDQNGWLAPLQERRQHH
jgi:hypothetical protein